MLLHIPKVLSAESLKRVREILTEAEWGDGRMTAGTQSAHVKRNQQLPEYSIGAREAQQLVLEGIGNNGLFISGALPQRVFPPLFNRYETGMGFGNHIDNAVRTHTATGQHIRTDVSATLFLADPDEYDGGELVIEDTFGSQSIKLPAGDMILYPASSVHRVTPVTRGTRLASFFWIESRVRQAERRRLLFDMDMSILHLRQAQGETDVAVKLTGCYHNLLRMWAGA
ncbi:MAG: Fe2+-dependent dioxygenase [Usitatibacteraceae bacterium]